MTNIFLDGERRTAAKGPVLLTLASALLMLGSNASAQVLKPVVEVFEQVAGDASIGANSTIANNWGGHQPRITAHADGTVRILYVAPRTDGTLNWKLRKRIEDATTHVGTWSDEASGQTTDDVALLRDFRNDLPYVLAWPNSVPFAYAGPKFTPTQIPGNWQVLPATARHYGNAGIAADGTICLKVSHEFSVLPLTSVSNMEFACGAYTAPADPTLNGSWKWGAMLVKPIGQRHAYDYLFPNPKGVGPGLYSFAQRDAHKLAEGLPNLTTETYVFNGAKAFAYDLSAPTPDVVPADAVTKLPVQSSTITAAPVERMQDSYLDSVGRVFTVYSLNDPLDATVRTRNVVVTKPNGAAVTTIKGAPILPAVGQTRVIEDAKARLWLLWNNPGGKKTEVYLYRLTETVTNGVSTFAIGPAQDISTAFYPYVLDGPMYIASVRGGNARSMYVHAIFNACLAQYVPNVNIDISTCYNKDKTGLQRVMYTRIRLPD
jgi:hypothetical protein